MYAEQTTMNKILAWTPEIGNVQGGFYPPQSQIIPDCKDNLLTNINSAALLLPYAKITSADANILTQASGHLHYNVQRLGMEDTATYTVTAVALDPWITIPATTKTYINPSLLQNIADSFGYTINPATPNKQPIRYVLKINNGLYDLTDTVQFFYGKFSSVIPISTSSFSSWNNNGWSVSNQIFHSAPSSFKSSLPNTNYPNNDIITIALKDTLDLTNAQLAYLQFYTRWDIEPKYDYVVVDVAEAGTNNWTSLCGKYTKPGDYDQPFLAPVYDDHQYDWLLEQMDLGPYLGKKVNLSISLYSDFFSNYSGMYIDDMQVTTVQDSTLTVANFTKTGQLTVYPNPAHDQLNVFLNDTQPGNSYLTLFDALGRKAATASFTQKLSLDVSTLAPGIYYLQVYNNDRVLPVQKIEIIR
jgi:hypothetical protein